MPAHRRIHLRDLPFNPARFPFFYGWMILGVGTLGVLTSAPGQTVGVSVFTDPLIGALGLSRSLLSLGYLVGTLASAFLLSRAGRLYDRHGGRAVATVAAVGLAATLLILSYSADISSALIGWIGWIPPTAIAFTLIAVLFFLLRFTGQGALTLASRNMIMEWFEARRGIANAIMGVSISFGFSIAPRVFEGVVGQYGWQAAWRWIALAVAGVALLAMLLYRDTPEAHGLKPDGKVIKAAASHHPETLPAHSFTLAEAKRTYAFWIFALTLALGSLLVTAYTFHVISIFADAGMNRVQAVGVFFPASVVAVSFQFFGSWLSDRVKLKFFGMAQVVGILLVTVGLVTMGPGAPVIVVIAGHGVMQGVFGITSNITWPRFFGRKHLGAISGFAVSLSVAGSAVGPYIFSFGRDLTGSYAVPAAICGVIATVLFAGYFWAERPAAPVTAE